MAFEIENIVTYPGRGRGLLRCEGLGSNAVVAAGGASLIHDTFSGVQATIDGRTPDTATVASNTWSSGIRWEVNGSGQARMTSTINDTNCVIDCGQTSYTITATTLNLYAANSVNCRYQDANNLWRISVFDSTSAPSNGRIDLIKRSGGSNTTIDTAAFSSALTRGSNVIITVVMTPTLITAYCDHEPGTTVTSTDTSFGPATSVGMIMGTGSTQPSANNNFDEYLVTT